MKRKVDQDEDDDTAAAAEKASTYTVDQQIATLKINIDYNRLKNFYVQSTVPLFDFDSLCGVVVDKKQNDAALKDVSVKHTTV